MRAPEPHLLRRAARVAVQVRDAGLTRAYSLDDPVAIRLPAEDAVWYAALYGPPEDDEGVHFAKGQLGLRYLRDLADRCTPERECERGVELLDVAYVPLYSLAPLKRGALQRAGFLPRTGEPVPDLTAKRRNGGRGAPDSRDLRRTATLLRALLRLPKARNRELPHGTLPTLTVADSAAEGVEVSAEVHADDLGRTEAPVRCSDDAATWPILDARWVLGIGAGPELSGVVEPHQTLFILDAVDGRTLRLCGGSDERTTAFAREFLRGVWIEELEPGFAREMIVLDEDLARQVEAALGPRGVEVRVAASHPAMDVAQRRLRTETARYGAADDLGTWRALAGALDLAVGRMFDAEADHRAVFRAFFGPWRPGVEDQDDSTVLRSALTTLTEWAAFSWRRSPRAPTVAERILRADLDELSRSLLEAHVAAAPSIYVVRGTDREAETLDIEDVFTGERVTANDRSLSASATRDLVIPLRVVPAGPFRLLWLAGPHFTAAQLPEALAEIERRGVEPTREGLASRPDVLGRLWPWAWERRKHPVTPRVANADGDELVFHEAVYEMTDGGAVRDALRRRADLEYVESEDAFSWRRPTRPGEEAWGEVVLLGNLRFLGDELIAEVNSERRLRALRAWLDGIPGLLHRGTKAASLDDLRARRRPLDDRLPETEPFVASPELRAAIAARLDAQWRAWPDLSLPMLDGRTPREACATPSGRAKVGAFLRTLTSPHPSYDIEPVRARLLRELGLSSSSTG